MFTLRVDQIEALAQDATWRARREFVQQLAAQGLTGQLDAVGNTIYLTDAEGSCSVLRFTGREAQLVSPTGRTFRFLYDDKNRLQELTDPGGLRVRFACDDRGRIVAVHRGETAPFQFEYDSSGSLAAIKWPDGAKCQLQHDAAGRATQVDDRGSPPRQYDYGEFGLPERIAIGDERAIVYGVEDNGEVSAAECPGRARLDFESKAPDGTLALLRGGSLVYTCKLEDEGNTTSFQFPDGGSARYTENNGQLTSASTSTSSVRFVYGPLGLVESEVQDRLTVTYERNAVGAIAAIVYPTGERLTFERDAEHRVVGMRDWHGRECVLAYDAAGALARVTYPNGTDTWRTNNPFGLPERITTSGEASGVINHLYQYDECDRVIVETLPSGDQRFFTYDSSGRLVRVASENLALNENFALDAFGNCIRQGSTEATFNASDEITSYGGAPVQHDAQGNIAECFAPDGSKLFLKHDAQGRLVEVLTDKCTARYAYDPIGRRTEKQIVRHDGVILSTTRFVWAGTLLLSEDVMRNGQLVQRTLYMPVPDCNLHIAQETDGKCFYLHHGRRLEPLAMTDATARTIWRAEYAAFGGAKVTGSHPKQPLRLQGQYFDDETGLHYNVARYFHPGLGRFLEPDPLGYAGGAWNDYLYCGGDPLNRSDPTGEIIPFILAGMAIGGAIGAGVEIYRQHKSNPSAPLDWGKIGREAAIGGAVGGIGVGVGIALAPAAGALGAGLAAMMAGGAVVGGVSAAVEACAEAFIRDRPISAKELGSSALVGIGIGAITAGVGGLMANRLRRLSRGVLSEAIEPIENAPRSILQLPPKRAIVGNSKMERKILYGEPKPTKPREIRGGHSRHVQGNDDFRFTEVIKNSDGTKTGTLMKRGEDGRWSKPKKGNTLFPDSWTDQRAIDASNRVAETKPIQTASDGRTLHRSKVDGVEIEVIKDADGSVSAAYPTGGRSTPSL